MKELIKSISKPPIERALYAIEKYLLAETVSMNASPIFIVGAPRTGSTLLYQVISVCFKVCYFSNFMMRFPRTPITIARITSPFGGCTAPVNFTSRYGESLGWRSPHQGYKTWGRWFPEQPDYLDRSAVSSQAIVEARTTIAHMQRIFEAPFINKWQKNSMRIRAINEVFPNALFIHITRDQALTAQSILHGRRVFLGNENAWLSAKPRNYHEIKKKSSLEQVCEQVFFIERQILRDLESLREDRWLSISYECLCENPEYYLMKVKHLYDQHHATSPLELRNDIPLKLRSSNRISVNLEEYRKIQKHLVQLKKADY